MEIRATIKKIIYHTEENGFLVAIMKNLSNGSTFKGVAKKGEIPDPKENSTYQLTGEFETGKYGEEFLITAGYPAIPITVEGIEKYLSNCKAEGIGPGIAKRIIDHFGDSIIQIMEKEQIERFTEVPGIGKKRIQALKNKLEEEKALSKLMAKLYSLNIEIDVCRKLYGKYKENCLEVISQNPYILIESVYGIGFKTADSIAINVGIPADSCLRISAVINYVLESEAANKGHVFLHKDRLMERSVAYLKTNPDYQTDYDKIEEIISDMTDTNCIIQEETKIYLPYYYKAESETAKLLQKINNSNWNNINIDSKTITKIEEKLNVSYDVIQKEAIKAAMGNKISILTGGPGTGKTTVIKGILEAMEMQNLTIKLVAPTGRAAKRMQETTGREATTIHKYLGVSSIGTMGGFNYNEDNNVEDDVLIIDESSMIDINLFYNLVKALPQEIKLIIVGDTDQLPSVGPGNVLKDLINSKQFYVTRLTCVHRQSEGSAIVSNAHRINKGEMPLLKKQREFAFIPEDNPQIIVKKIIEYTKNLMDRKEDVQILCPMKKSIIGTEELNLQIQKQLNQNSQSVKIGFREFKVNDKIMQIKNDYEKAVFNGDIGTIKEIDEYTKKIQIEFEGSSSIKEYEFSETKHIVLAYASTVHKSQGSEYQWVIMPLTTTFSIMLQRNLLYTAITRAKKRFILIGTKEAIYRAVQNNSTAKRNSGLAERLSKCANT